VTDPCPVALMKSIKNDVEIAGMRHAHVSDSHVIYIPWSLVLEALTKSNKLYYVDGLRVSSRTLFCHLSASY